MIQHDNILLVPVPVGASKFEIINGDLYYLDGDKFLRSVRLPVGFKLTLHGIATTLSEDVCKGLVDAVDLPRALNCKAYRNYGKGISWYDLETATFSLLSLILHYGYDPQWCVVVGIS